jgi:hypothetical protein
MAVDRKSVDEMVTEKMICLAVDRKSVDEMAIEKMLCCPFKLI